MEARLLTQGLAGTLWYMHREQCMRAAAAVWCGLEGINIFGFLAYLGVLLLPASIAVAATCLQSLQAAELYVRLIVCSALTKLASCCGCLYNTVALFGALVGTDAAGCFLPDWCYMAVTEGVLTASWKASMRLGRVIRQV